FGSEVEQQAQQYLDFRYRLQPYIYSEAARVTFNGSTLMRPLVMDFASDNTALDQKYEFMFGPAFLVSPVLEGGATNWNVYLPKSNGGWFDFWTGEHFKGGQTVNAAAPLSEIPLHVRAGSIIPFGPAQQFSAEKPADPIELRVYPGADGAFTLYEDEGVNYNYEKGAYATIPIHWNNKTQMLGIGQREGTFSGMLKEREFRIVLVRPGAGAGMACVAEAGHVMKYNGDAINVSCSAW
ncbi:MAG TPA: DUF5110 domain-containing protein, partial [Verrucomicrobiae bacterium]